MRAYRSFCLMLFVLALSRSWASPLDDYVVLPDPSYTYSVHDVQQSLLYDVHVLRLTSQTWRDPSDVNHTVWEHWLTMVVPAGQSGDHAMLIIGGGNTFDPAPEPGIDSFEVAVALATGAVTAVLYAVPNQPLVFAEEPGVAKREDAIIAYSWDQFLRGGDDFWPVQLPMTKAAVRAMDTLQTHAATLSSPIDLQQFVVTGGSKRGWTTWLTGAVDDRVVGMAPLVIDLLNMQPSFQNHHAAYGFWAPAVQDYEEKKIFSWFGTPEMNALISMVDPHAYRHRYDALPTYGMNASGDDFFLPDSAQFYFPDMPGVKYLRYVPNANHGFTGHEDALLSIRPFYQAVVSGQSMPQFSWTLPTPGTIEITTVDAPSAVNLWQATNASTRDFRITTTGEIWQDSTLPDLGNGLYRAQVPEPAEGWTAFFVELEFDGGFVFTTEVEVVPEFLPFAGDFNADAEVNADDLGFWCERWRNHPCPVQDGWCQMTDLNRSGTVNITDGVLFINTWYDP